MISFLVRHFGCIAPCGFLGGGDFNNVKAIDNVRAKTLPQLPSIYDIEQDAWDRFLFLVGFSDAWHELSFLWVLGSLELFLPSEA